MACLSTQCLVGNEKKSSVREKKKNRPRHRLILPPAPNHRKKGIEQTAMYVNQDDQLPKTGWLTHVNTKNALPCVECIFHWHHTQRIPVHSQPLNQAGGL